MPIFCITLLILAIILEVHHCMNIKLFIIIAKSLPHYFLRNCKNYKRNFKTINECMYQQKNQKK